MTANAVWVALGYTSDSRRRDCSALVAGRSPIVELPAGTWESAEAIATSGPLGRVNS